MEISDVLDVGRDALWVLVQVSGPVMMVGLAVGLFVSLFQSITQIQEMTLTFVPKILAVFISLTVLLPYMFQTLTEFMHRVAVIIIG